MATKTDKTRILIIAFAAVVLIGFVLLIGRQLFAFSGLAFEILTYVLSIAAIILAVLSVLNSIRQGRAINRMVRDVHAAVAELREVSDSNDKMEHELSEEYHMNKVIIDVLAEYGIGENHRMRQTVAKRVSHRLKKVAR